mmetsp:Transcript_78997/g.223583  ORF Transcript_78997/g.223583 Transcript_78997/m.223583 type:complete len:205 (+) Transcript_78997:140-754(+)
MCLTCHRSCSNPIIGVILFTATVCRQRRPHCQMPSATRFPLVCSTKDSMGRVEERLRTPDGSHRVGSKPRTVGDSLLSLQKVPQVLNAATHFVVAPIYVLRREAVRQGRLQVMQLLIREGALEMNINAEWVLASVQSQCPVKISNGLLWLPEFHKLPAADHEGLDVVGVVGEQAVHVLQHVVVHSEDAPAERVVPRRLRHLARL